MENAGIQCQPAGMHGRQQNCAVYVHRRTKERNKYRASGETEHEYVSFRKNRVSSRQNLGCCGFRSVFTAGNIVWLLMFVYLWGNAVYIYVPPIFRSPLPYLRGRLFGRCGGCLHSGCGHSRQPIRFIRSMGRMRSPGKTARWPGRYSIRWKDNILRRDMPRFRDTKSWRRGLLSRRVT